MAARPFPALLPLVVLIGGACGAALALALHPADAAGGPSDASGAGGAVERQAPPDAPEAALRTDPAGAPGSSAPTPDPASLTGSERASARAAEVMARHETLRTEVERLRARIAEAEPEAVEADPQAFRFGVQATSPNFDGADWQGLAGHMLELAKVLVSIRDEVLAGGRPSAKSMQGIQKHNTPLGLFALSIGPEMGDVSPQIAYTHPAVIANLIRSALIEAGDPLTRSQEVAIATLGDAWQRERARTVLPANTPELGRMVVEVEAKLRFLEDVKALLSPSQRSLLFDPETEGRSQLDLLSPAWVLVMRRPLPFADRAAMETGLIDALLGLAEIEVEDETPFAWVARTWVDEVPGVLEPRTERSQDVVFPRIRDLLPLARAEVRAIERLTGSGLLTPEQRTALLGVTWLLHPFRTPTEAAPPEDGE